MEALQHVWLRRINFDAKNKEQAEAIRDIIAYLQEHGVKVSVAAE